VALNIGSKPDIKSGVDDFANHHGDSFLAASTDIGGNG
jgi:hypothetical protein